MYFNITGWFTAVIVHTVRSTEHRGEYCYCGGALDIHKINQQLVSEERVVMDITQGFEKCVFTVQFSYAEYRYLNSHLFLIGCAVALLGGEAISLQARCLVEAGAALGPLSAVANLPS